MKKRGECSVPSLLVSNNKSTPYITISKGFTNIVKQHLGSEISISEYRIISTSVIKKKGTHEEYQQFCALCLHSESVSNKYYVKTDDGEISEMQQILQDCYNFEQVE